MATIKIERFGGISPRTHPTLLQDGMAVVAENVRLKNGKIVPLREPSTTEGVDIYTEGGLANLSDANSMHVWRINDGTMRLVAFKGMSWMSRGNIADDDRSRVIVSGDTSIVFEDEDGVVWNNSPQIMMMGENGRVFHPICKVPLDKPNVSRLGGEIVTDTVRMRGYYTVDEINEMAFGQPMKGDLAVVIGMGNIQNAEGGILGVVDGIKVYYDGVHWSLYETTSNNAATRYTYFFWTWVDGYGYESPVSDSSDEVVYNDGDYVSFLSPDYIPQDAASIRVYKVVTGTETGRIQFVCEKSVRDAMNGFSFAVKDEDAGEVISEIESPPPDMKCILDVPGGFYCGFSETKPKTVCFSDVDLIYSWPIAYQYDVKDNIVALAVTSNTVFALTEGTPYVLNGTSPDGMTVSKLAGDSACVSAKGVCVYRNAVYFVGNAGLMTIYNNSDAGTVCENLTDKIFTKDQWNSLNPSSCVIGQHDGVLYLSFTKTDNSKYGLSIDLSESSAAVTTHSESMKCACVDPKTDKMYFVRG